jgi:hypothetical protein
MALVAAHEELLEIREALAYSRLQPGFSRLQPASG